PWIHTGYDNHEPLRSRKLLLHKNEIAFLERGVAAKGYTVVPLRIYTKNGRAKIELGLARGKRRYEKRQVIKEREATREMDAAVRRRVPRAELLPEGRGLFADPRLADLLDVPGRPSPPRGRLE